jgi:hypothetical protein
MQSVLAHLDEQEARAPVCLLLAGSGSGKSTFVAQLVRELRQKSHFDCIATVFIGSVENSTRIFKVLHALCQELQTHVEDNDEEVSTPDDMMGLQKKGRSDGSHMLCRGTILT